MLFILTFFLSLFHFLLISSEIIDFLEFSGKKTIPGTYFAIETVQDFGAKLGNK
jgi:hypothetical protein